MDDTIVIIRIRHWLLERLGWRSVSGERTKSPPAEISNQGGGTLETFDIDDQHTYENIPLNGNVGRREKPSAIPQLHDSAPDLDTNYANRTIIYAELDLGKEGSSSTRDMYPMHETVIYSQVLVGMCPNAVQPTEAAVDQSDSSSQIESQQEAVYAVVDMVQNKPKDGTC